MVDDDQGRDVRGDGAKEPIYDMLADVQKDPDPAAENHVDFGPRIGRTVQSRIKGEAGVDDAACGNDMPAPDQAVSAPETPCQVEVVHTCS